MSLVRDMPFSMVALEDTILATCSALMSTAASTSVKGMLSNKSTGSAIISTGDIGNLSTNEGTKLVSSGGMTVASTQGALIDRLSFPLGAHYGAAVVQASLVSTVGSTEADRKLALGVKLQHGDSSGGGDLADYSTDFQPNDRLYFGTSARTTDMLAWDTAKSSGALFAVSNPGYYDLRAAKRFLKVAVRAGKNSVTTESSGDEQSRVGAVITFLAGDQTPARADTTSPFSSTTSTA